MKLFQAVKGWMSRKRVVPPVHDDWWFNQLVPDTLSGVKVDEESALRFITIFACIKLLADTTGSLPLDLFRKGNGGNRTALSSPISTILGSVPNNEMSTFRFWSLVQAYLAAWGNAYVFIDRAAGGWVKAVWPVYPGRINVFRDPSTRMLAYKYQASGGQTIFLTTSDIWHIPGFGFDGLRGYSPIGCCMEGIALGIAVEQYGSKYFSQGTHLGVVFEHPEHLTDEAYDRLKSSLSKAHQGLSNAHKAIIIEEGMKASKLSIPPAEMGFIQQQEFSTENICRLFRIPPHMVMSEKRSTFNNIEHQGLNFVIHTMRPWLTLIERDMERYFLPVSQRGDLQFEFNVKALLRGDFKTRMEGYGLGVNSGIFTRNECRKWERLNPHPGKGADKLTVQLAMTDLDNAVDPPAPLAIPAQKKSTGVDEESERWAMDMSLETRTRRSVMGRDRLTASFMHLVMAQGQALVDSEVESVRRFSKRHIRGDGQMESFIQAVKQYYRQEFPAQAKRIMGPTFRAFAEAIYAEAVNEVGQGPGMGAEFDRWVENYLDRYAQRHADSSSGQLISLTSVENPEDAVATRLTEWGEKRSGKIARNETVREGNGVALFVYFAVGLSATWNIRGADTCPFCRSLQGKKIISGQSFVESGTELQPEGVTTTMKVVSRKQHPPLHAGCDCYITGS